MIKSSTHEVVVGSCLVAVFAGYESIGDGLRVRERVGWVVYHSNCKHRLQRLLLTIHQFSRSER